MQKKLLKRLKLIRAFMIDNWLPLTIGLVTVGSIGLLLIFRLGSLLGGLSDSEVVLRQQVLNDALTIKGIAAASIFLPYNLMLYVLQATPFTGPTGIRSVGVLFGVLGAAGMFYIFRTWYTVRIAILGSLLFASSSWFLHTARFADASSSYLLLPLIVAAMIALQRKIRSRTTMLAAVVFGTAMVYLPGLVLFILPAILIKRKVILKALLAQPIWYRILIGLSGAIMLSPLVYSVIKSQNPLQFIGSIIGLPTNGLLSLPQMAEQLWTNLGNIFVFSSAGPLYTAGHLPWLDVCTSILALLGAIQFIRYWRLDRSKLIGLTAALGLVLIALGGSVSYVILLPLLYLLVVEGLKWLLELWMEIFPKNPFARSFAVSIIVLLSVSVMLYQTNKYYLAWGRAPETRQVFNNRP